MYQLRLKVVNKDGEVVIEILFWDGFENGIVIYKYEVEKEFENCVCCFVNFILVVSQILIYCGIIRIWGGLIFVIL